MARSETPAFGRIPQDATHWSVRKRGALTWEWCTYAGRDGVAHQEFSIEDLSLALVRKRWGSGTYRVMFLSVTRGTRRVFGNGRVFELVGANQSGTPRTAGRQPSPPPQTPVAVVRLEQRGASPAMTAPTSEHADMVRALLAAGEGRQNPKELFDALAIPTGIGLSNLFTFQDRASERLEAIERRLAAIESRIAAGSPTTNKGPGDASAPREEHALTRVLDKLEAIEDRLARGQDRRRASPTPR